MRLKTKTFGRGAKKKNAFLQQRKRFCRFCVDKTKTIDYKDIKALESFVKEGGKMVSSRYSGNCARHQRRVAEEVKKARFLALLPYTRV